MSDGKRRRYRKPKTEQQQQQNFILAKRNDDERNLLNVMPKVSEVEVQKKILLKSKNDRETRELEEVGNGTEGYTPQKTIIVTRSETTQSPTLSLNTGREHQQQQQQHLTNNETSQQASTSASSTSIQIVESIPQMSRPVTVISSTGFINSNAKKLLLKSNTEFLVVGVIGTQGVGKSTILNLLANEEYDYDYYNKVFVEEECVFPTKLKIHKCSARSRTESTHMFITSDRIILLDSPPVMCNSYKKDMTASELDDLRNIITFLTSCHLVIVIQDDYFNMNFMRLLQFAELMKPTQDKAFVSDYFPNLLFVKNRAKRLDFTPGQKDMMDLMIKTFFKDSQMRIFKGQTTERQKKGRITEAERVVNSFLFPEVKGSEATSYHKPLKNIIEDFRKLVFMTPRNEIYSGQVELNESIWFELFSQVSQDSQHFFFNTYEDIHRKHLDVGSSSNSNNNVKDTQDMWKD